MRNLKGTGYKRIVRALRTRTVIERTPLNARLVITFKEHPEPIKGADRRKRQFNGLNERRPSGQRWQ